MYIRVCMCEFVSRYYGPAHISGTTTSQTFFRIYYSTTEEVPRDGFYVKTVKYRPVTYVKFTCLLFPRWKFTYLRFNCLEVIFCTKLVIFQGNY